MAAEHRSEWVQPIVVDKAGTHHATIKAAAVASVLAWHAGRDVDPAPWGQWLSGPFTKTVRRTNRTRLDRIADEHGGVTVHVGDSCATALAPHRYVDLPRDIARLQVTGTDLPRLHPHTRDVIDVEVGWPGQPPPAPAPVRLVVDSSLTTGKAAAQAAHALFARALRTNSQDFETWLANPLAMRLHLVGRRHMRQEAAQPDVIVIRDAGFTEVASGTVTAVANLPRRWS